MGHKLFVLILAGTAVLKMHGASLQNPGQQHGAHGATVERRPVTPSRRLTIRVYDYTGIKPKALERTRKEASRVLAAAGIDLRWERCRTSEKGTSQDASCAHRTGAHLIQLRIHPREMSKKLTSRSIEFGYSIPLDNSFGFIAGVYLDRTNEVAQSLGLDLHVMLGHTIAHEIGHLLLGTNSHANEGVMRPTWGDREVRLANTGQLGFTEAQALRMQAQVARRLASAECPREAKSQTQAISEPASSIGFERRDP